MTEQEQRIAIAEACGWTAITSDCVGIPPRLVEADAKFVPDYLHDLNAMSYACKCLDIHQRVMFYGHLYAIVQREFDGENDEDSYAFALVNATATQRSEAFLRTVGKWKD